MMQIRLDPENAAAVKREAVAHRRLFKRRRSYADVVNSIVRKRFIVTKGGLANTEVQSVVANAKHVFGWGEIKPKPMRKQKL